MNNALMRRLQYWAIGGILACSMIMACDAEEDILKSNNGSLAGTKWIGSDMDYLIGDDWITLYDESIVWYFYSDTEGMLYYFQKKNDSDDGYSSSRKSAFFSYEVSGSDLELTYITPPIWGNSFETMPINDLREFDKNIMSSSDYSFISSLRGTTGECEWYMNMQGDLLITGKGTMTDYNSFSATPWSDLKYLTAVIVEEGVTSVGAYAFASPSIGYVELPYTSLRRIGTYAFANSGISDIHLCYDIAEIGDYAFSNCSWLKSVELPELIKEISDGTFYGCTRLSNVYMPESLEIIGEFAFDGCNNLSVSIAGCKNLRSIGDFAFEGPTVIGFTPSKVLAEVGSCAFTKLAVSTLELPSSLKRIEGVSFQGSFSSIYISKGTTYISNNAFVSYAKSGIFYINSRIPIDTGNSIITDGNWGMENKWSLHVPTGCRSTYSKKSPWNRFKSIQDDSSLNN